MQVAGIIAEYNPLHNGHVYHIEATKEKTGCSHVCVILSGNFVQRGEVAVADKFTRASWALNAGADIVLELPTVFAVSSAERFARGSVRSLASTGILSHLSFGSEIDDIDLLRRAATIDEARLPGFSQSLAEHLSLGKSYPRARYEAMLETDLPDELIKVFLSPNSVLGLEYIRALNEFSPSTMPVACMRKGKTHDEEGLHDEGFSSASAIRDALRNRNMAAASSMPMHVSTRFLLGDVPPVTMEDCSYMLRYALLSMDKAQLRDLGDVVEGFENVLYRAARKATSYDELLSSLKSKRYTLARTKRIALSALLGISKTHTSIAAENGAGYLRVLGFKASARPLLSTIAKKASVPLLLRHSDIASLSDHAKQLLSLDIHAHDGYRLILQKHNEHIPRDFADRPIIIG